MPVMNGLQTTKLIRSYEDTGNWEAARKAGIEQCLPASNECSVPPKNRIHIIAVSNFTYCVTHYIESRRQELQHVNLYKHADKKPYYTQLFKQLSPDKEYATCHPLCSMVLLNLTIFIF